MKEIVKSVKRNGDGGNVFDYPGFFRAFQGFQATLSFARLGQLIWLIVKSEKLTKSLLHVGTPSTVTYRRKV